MKMLRTWVFGLLSLVATSVMAADYTIDGQYVTIPVKQVKAEGAKVVRLQVVNDHIIRVQATSESSLMPMVNCCSRRPSAERHSNLSVSLIGKLVPM